MSKKIICVGRGGVGKSSFLAGLSFLLKSKRPLLILDADPDEHLAHLLGIDGSIHTISEMLFKIKEGQVPEDIKSASLPQRIDYLMQQDCLYEGDFFDFLSLGVKWSQGCYCQPNNILKGLLARLEKNYNLVLIDSPAGLEHINRRITSEVDSLFILLDPSQKSIEGVSKFQKLLRELKIRAGNIYLVANFRFPEASLGLVREKTGMEVIGRLPYDKAVEQINLKGESFENLEKTSPFLMALSAILARTGI